jgi:hypothetical protein
MARRCGDCQPLADCRTGKRIAANPENDDDGKGEQCQQLSEREALLRRTIIAQPDDSQRYKGL